MEHVPTDGRRRISEKMLISYRGSEEMLCNISCERDVDYPTCCKASFLWAKLARVSGSNNSSAYKCPCATDIFGGYPLQMDMERGEGGGVALQQHLSPLQPHGVRISKATAHTYRNPAASPQDRATHPNPSFLLHRQHNFRARRGKHQRLLTRSRV